MVEDVLNKMSNVWSKKAQVKEECKIDSIELVETAQDFIPELIPFYGTQYWKEISQSHKDKLTSYGWILYNLKTIQIESDVVSPACMDFISTPYSDKSVATINRSACEALTDEAYHILLSVRSNDEIYKFRNLERLSKPEFSLVKSLKMQEESCNAEWERRLTRLAYACVSETLVSDYLDLLAKNDSIQNMCKMAVSAHAEDEWMHASVFTLILDNVYTGLSHKEKSFLLSKMRPAISAFKDSELSSWENPLRLLGLDPKRLYEQPSTTKSEMNLDLSGVENLLNRIDVPIDYIK